MITDKPVEFWDNISKKKNWREYILPQRTDKEFYDEGLRQANFLLKFYKPGDTVLEYGCGIGRILRHIKAKRKIGLDISERFLAIARLEDSSEYYLANEFYGQADFVYCLSVIQHNNSQERLIILNRIKDLLAPGGSALISFPNQDSQIYNETEFVHKFSLDEVKQYGLEFDYFDIFVGDLVNYKSPEKSRGNEYFLLVKKYDNRNN